MHEEAIKNFRLEFGDKTEPYAFSDEEVGRFITVAEGNMTKAKIAAIDRLIADNRALHAFSAGSRSGSPGEIIEHLLAWRAALSDELVTHTMTSAASGFAGGAEPWR